MTKEEFKGFGLAAQHDMVLEALVRVTKNLETIEKEKEKENGKPFVGTVKQRRNDIKLLTIRAAAFGKTELVWNHHDEVFSRGAALYTGLGQKVYAEGTKPIKDIMDAKEKIENAQQRSGHFMSCKSSTDTTSYPDGWVKRS